MDADRFDRLTRALMARLSRRSGVAAGLAALAAGADAASGERRGGNRGPRQEVPCGNGARKDNICTKDKDCCTGICETKMGRTNRDGSGRCRCLRRGAACKQTRNCCGALTCVSGICGSAGPTPPPPPPPPPPDVCTVCASGCAFTSVDAAIAAASAGDIISIDSGTYPTYAALTKSLSLVNCKGATDVYIDQNGTDTYALYDDLTGPSDTVVSISGLNFGLVGNTRAGQWVGSQGNVTYTIDNCTFEGGDHSLYLFPPGSGINTITNSTFRSSSSQAFYLYGYQGGNTARIEMTDCLFENCAGGLFLNSSSSGDGVRLTRTTVTNSTNSNGNPSIEHKKGSLTLTDCTISGTTSSNAPALYISASEAVTTTLAGTTTISGNAVTGTGAGQGGGGINVYDNGGPVTLAFVGTSVSITNNTCAGTTCGPAIFFFDKGSTLTVTGAPNITGNTPAPQCAKTDGVNNSAVPDCATF